MQRSWFRLLFFNCTGFLSPSQEGIARKVAGARLSSNRTSRNAENFPQRTFQPLPGARGRGGDLEAGRKRDMRTRGEDADAGVDLGDEDPGTDRSVRAAQGGPGDKDPGTD